MTIKVLFCGDFAPCRGFEKLVVNQGAAIFGDALPLLGAADLSFVNLECPLTLHPHQIAKSGPALKADPACVDALLPFSVIGLANNHILDYGEAGLADTLTVLEKHNLSKVGAGMTLKCAQKPHIAKIEGVKFAIIALAEHEFNQSEAAGWGSAPIDLIDNFNQIKQAQAQVDIIIVTLHGGNEYFPYPRPGLRKICQHYVDLGADAVICHHPHVPGAYEYYQGKPIVYSLGNFIFDIAKPPQDWDLGYMVQLRFDSGSKKFESLKLIPYKQSINLGGVKLLKDKEKDDFAERFETYRQKLENHRAWLNEWHNFVHKQADNYILLQYLPFTMRGLSLLARKTPISKIFINHKNNLQKLNMIRCQSHRELLIAALKTKG